MDRQSRFVAVVEALQGRRDFCTHAGRARRNERACRTPRFHSRRTERSLRCCNPPERDRRRFHARSRVDPGISKKYIPLHSFPQAFNVHAELRSPIHQRFRQAGRQAAMNDDLKQVGPAADDQHGPCRGSRSTRTGRAQARRLRNRYRCTCSEPLPPARLQVAGKRFCHRTARLSPPPLPVRRGRGDDAVEVRGDAAHQSGCRRNGCDIHAAFRHGNERVRLRATFNADAIHAASAEPLPKPEAGMLATAISVNTRPWAPSLDCGRRSHLRDGAGRPEVRVRVIRRRSVRYRRSMG